MVQRMLRVPDVLELRGRSRASHYNDIRAGLYTPPVKLGPRLSGWPYDEVEALQAATIAGRPPEAIKKLVLDLTAQRTAGSAQ